MFLVLDEDGAVNLKKVESIKKRLCKNNEHLTFYLHNHDNPVPIIIEKDVWNKMWLALDDSEKNIRFYRKGEIDNIPVYGLTPS